MAPGQSDEDSSIMTPEVSDLFASLDQDRAALSQYNDYWQGIAPDDDKGIFQRYLFAFCSVHTTWRGNIRGYEAIKDFHPDDWSFARLGTALQLSGCGMHNNRTDWIY